MSPKRDGKQKESSSPYHLRTRPSKYTASLALCFSDPSATSRVSLTTSGFCRSTSHASPPPELDFNQVIQQVHDDLDSIYALYRRAMLHLRGVCVYGSSCPVYVLQLRHPQSDVAAKLAAQRKKITELQESFNALDDVRKQASAVQHTSASESLIFCSGDSGSR
ncbi:hypothetical protein JVT61DRAFT_12357 [Boletus reticuloceps]|uniref:Uncharacterized protein n=1 Tax=Boletus reticuloceps TaxID=495285 RepID=A0A8I3A354_9AGAM|nr:hypothetical protein JVT61DRAFT_12357 [Boletus reticuloceps]